MLKTLQSQEKKNTVVTGSGYTQLDWSQENSHPFSTAGKATAARDTATGGETQMIKYSLFVLKWKLFRALSA